MAIEVVQLLSGLGRPESNRPVHRAGSTLQTLVVVHHGVHFGRMAYKLVSAFLGEQIPDAQRAVVAARDECAAMRS